MWPLATNENNKCWWNRHINQTRLVKVNNENILWYEYVGIFCHQSVFLLNLALVLLYDDNNDGINFVFKFHEVSGDYGDI